MRLTWSELLRAARSPEYVFAYRFPSEREASFFIRAGSKEQADLQLADARKRFGPLRLVRVEKLAN